MLVSALMMRDIWRPAMSEAAIRSALRKLGPAGDVSHEEAVGGQAVREGASEYAALVDSAQALRARGAVADGAAMLRRAETVLATLNVARENYHMIDDEFQLPIVAARWLRDPGVTAAQRRAFLMDSSDGGGTRLARLIRELSLVARLTAPYAARPDATNLVSFPPRDSGWASASWRDSGAGYAGGRYAMDVNTIWVPHALEATAVILAAVRELGLAPERTLREESMSDGAPLARWMRAPDTLRAAIATWKEASRHFVVTLPPADVRARIGARLDAMPAMERAFWSARLRENGADRDSLTFLALSLDEAGHPIEVANTDPATRLFLGAREGPPGPLERVEMSRVLRDVRLFVRPYPAGLLVDGVGPATSNDAFATPRVWRLFEHDAYHGPRVVWGREVNLFLLGIANQIAQATAASGAGGAGGAVSAVSAVGTVRTTERTAYVEELRAAAQRVRSAVAASGFHGELWSYGFTNGRLVPMRYGTAGDVQLWSTTELAVEYALSRAATKSRR